MACRFFIKLGDIIASQIIKASYNIPKFFFGWSILWQSYICSFSYGFSGWQIYCSHHYWNTIVVCIDLSFWESKFDKINFDWWKLTHFWRQNNNVIKWKYLYYTMSNTRNFHKWVTKILKMTKNTVQLEYNQNFLLTIKSIQLNARFVCENYTQYRRAKKSCNSKDLTCGNSLYCLN